MSNEERSRIFAVYFGSPCQFVDKGKVSTRIGTVGVIAIQRTMSIPNYNCKLLLTPFDQITDEDAIEVAKIEFGYNKPLTEEEISKGFTKATDAEFVEIVKENLDMFHSQSVDYLRSKSYNIGYGQYSAQDLIDLGIVHNQNVQK